MNFHWPHVMEGGIIDKDFFKTVEEYQDAFEHGRYLDMGNSFCHENMGRVEWLIPQSLLFPEDGYDPKEDTVAKDEAWVSLGTCSFQAHVLTGDIPMYPESYGTLLEKLDHAPFELWPLVAQQAARRVGEWILAEFQRGSTGC